MAIVRCDKCGRIYNDYMPFSTLCPEHPKNGRIPASHLPPIKEPAMTPGEYQAKALHTMAPQSTIKERNYDDRQASALLCNLPDQSVFLFRRASDILTQIDNASRGLSGDAGEVSTCVQKCLEYGKPLDITNLKEELGDVLWRVAQMCDAVGFTIEDVMVANIAKLSKRYPDKYSDEHAAEENRDRAAERAAIEGAAPSPQAIEQTGQGWAEPTPEFRMEDLDKERMFKKLHCIEQCTCEVVDFDWPNPTLRFNRRCPVHQATIVANGFFGDGTVREGRHHSYMRDCKECGKPIHNANTAEVCPDCFVRNNPTAVIGG